MRIQPRIVVWIGVVFTSFSAIFIRLSEAPPLAIASYRMLFTTLLLTPLLVGERLRGRSRSGRRTLPEAQDRDAVHDIPSFRAAVLLSVASGGFLAAHFALWITSLSYTSIASSTVLVTTHPIIVALVGLVVLGERLSLRGVIYMVAALGGSLVLVWGGFETQGSAPLGNLLAFLGAVAVSGYIILGRIVRRRLTVNVYTFIVYSVAGLLLVCGALAAGVPLYPYTMREIAIFLGLALFCTLLGHSLLNWALRFVRPTIVSTSILGEPVIAGVLAVFIFGEMPTRYTVIGGAVILAAIYLFVREEASPTR